MSPPVKKSIVLRRDNSIMAKKSTAAAAVANSTAVATINTTVGASKAANTTAAVANKAANTTAAVAKEEKAPNSTNNSDNKNNNNNDINNNKANNNKHSTTASSNNTTAPALPSNQASLDKAVTSASLDVAVTNFALPPTSNNTTGNNITAGTTMMSNGSNGNNAQAAVVGKGGGGVQVVSSGEGIDKAGGSTAKEVVAEKVKSNQQVVVKESAAASQLPQAQKQQGTATAASAAQQIQSKNVNPNVNNTSDGQVRPPTAEHVTSSTNNATTTGSVASTQGTTKQQGGSGTQGHNNSTKAAAATAQQHQHYHPHHHHHQWTQQQHAAAYADYYKQYQQQVAAYNKAQQQQVKNKDGSTSGVAKDGGIKPENVESNDQVNKISLDGEKKKKDGDSTKSSAGGSDEKKKEGEDSKAPIVSSAHPPQSHHQQHYHHYAAWHAHHQAAAARAWHQQQQQQGQGASGKGGQGQGQGQQPPQHYYPYWPGYQHPHAAAYHAQQQQLAAARGGQQQGTTTVLPVAHQGKGQGNINCAQAVIEKRKKVKGTKKEFAPPKHIQSNKNQHRRMDSKSSKSLSVSSSVGSTVASLSKKRSREESFDEEGRDDLNTKSLSLSEDDDNVSTSGLSLGGFSLGSLGRLSESPNKRRKGQSIHRMDEDAASTLSDEGKMILKTLSINASYSAEFADLYNDPSPMNASSNSDVNMSSSTDEKSVSFDEGLTPKKRNTSNKKKRVVINTSLNEDSPTMLDLIGGAETPTTGMLMNSIMESALKDDESSLNAHLRNQTFTPLPIMMSDNVADHHGPPTGRSEASAIMAMMGNSSGDLSITPQLSWGMDGNTSLGGSSPPLEITPRCFGLLDSTKSSRSDNFHPLGSPKRFWTDNVLNKSATSMDSNGSSSTKKKSILSILSPTMRAMKVAEGGGGEEGKVEPTTPSTSPLPFHSSVGDENSNNQGGADGILKSILKNDPKTPMRKSTIHGVNDPAAVPSSTVVSAQSTTVIPVQMQQHAHGSTSPWGDYLKPSGSGGGSFAPSPIPPIVGGAQSPYGYHPNMFYPHQQLDHPTPEGGGGDSKDEHDRVRNLRGSGPPRHQLPPSHNLPPPSYHHFSPLTTNFPGQYSSPYPPHLMPNQLDMMGGGIAGDSSRKCIPIKHPIPQKFQGDIDKFKDVQLPDFNSLVNFPGHMTKNPTNVPDGMRCCVMCGQACKCTKVGKGNAKGGYTNHGPGTPQPQIVASSSNIPMAVHPPSSSSTKPLGDKSDNNNNNSNNNTSTPMKQHNTDSLANTPRPNPYLPKANIPTQNKGLCTICDVNVWVVVATGLEIKWCKGCKNFKAWAAFGEKGLATKCVKCRARQREKYLYNKSDNNNTKKSGSRKKGSSGLGLGGGLSVNKSTSPKNNVGVGGEIGSL